MSVVCNFSLLSWTALDETAAPLYQRKRVVWMTIAPHCPCRRLSRFEHIHTPTSSFITHPPDFQAYYDITSLQLIPEAPRHDISVCTQVGGASLLSHDPTTEPFLPINDPIVQ